MEKKICIFFVNWENPGGVEKRARTLYKVLSKKYTVNLLTYDILPKGKAQSASKDLIWWIKFRKFVKNIFFLRKKIKNYDLVICFSQFPALISILTSKKHVFVKTGSSFYYRDSTVFSKLYWAWFLQPLIYFFTSAIVPASPHLIPKLIKSTYLSKKVKYISGLVDLEKLNSEYNFEQTPNHIEKIGNYICLSSALSGHKGIIQFIKLYKKYLEKYLTKDPMKLIILGDGPLLNTCKSLCSSLQIHWGENMFEFPNSSPMIYFLGFCDNPIFYIKNSKLFVFPSFYEGLSNQLIEALYCNVPVIATNCPGNKFLIDSINTDLTDKESPIMLLPPLNSTKSEKIWVNAINEISEGIPFETLATRQECLSKFSVSSNSKKWISLVDKLL